MGVSNGNCVCWFLYNNVLDDYFTVSATEREQHYRSHINPGLQPTCKNSLGVFRQCIFMLIWLADIRCSIYGN